MIVLYGIPADEGSEKGDKRQLFWSALVVVIAFACVWHLATFAKRARSPRVSWEVLLDVVGDVSLLLPVDESSLIHNGYLHWPNCWASDTCNEMMRKRSWLSAASYLCWQMGSTC